MHTPTPDASPWVRRFAAGVRAGEVLDLACGGGRHARLFAALGHPVLAVDRDPQALALAAGPGITTLQTDLEEGGARWPFAAGRFAGIVVTNYLHRPLMNDLVNSLAPGGVLIYETFALGNELYGKPSNPAFLLHPGELLELATGTGLTVLAFEDGVVALPKPARVQRLCAAGRAFPQTEAKLDHLVGRE
ncbi:bifunctional 2-polyprenyl-6-hydroxyphenol methylase/3-demethylubiquinol 3-O-methyltransferase UbiG [Massilia sp. Leaf139]|uniref:class I SAM-dependent methyltransferase n=1 Tax=Massilia sp. Leaf139 TaxID=1736272 RepID=UPI0006F46EA4|nr:class I SAM-dependent methyltransferase [Massilia sp. Leaf139]KQQ96531.1 SAM-dependent methyltransferase [Massilia sp. Leaf139]